MYIQLECMSFRKCELVLPKVHKNNFHAYQHMGYLHLRHLGHFSDLEIRENNFFGPFEVLTFRFFKPTNHTQSQIPIPNKHTQHLLRARADISILARGYIQCARALEYFFNKQTSSQSYTIYKTATHFKFSTCCHSIESRI